MQVANLTKSPLLSKTLWFNTVVFVATFILDHAGLLPALGVKPQTILEITSICNLLLRLVTYTGISWTGKPG